MCILEYFSNFPSPYFGTLIGVSSAWHWFSQNNGPNTQPNPGFPGLDVHKLQRDVKEPTYYQMYFYYHSRRSFRLRHGRDAVATTNNSVVVVRETVRNLEVPVPAATLIPRLKPKRTRGIPIIIIIIDGANRILRRRRQFVVDTCSGCARGTCAILNFRVRSERSNGWRAPVVLLNKNAPENGSVRRGVLVGGEYLWEFTANTNHRTRRSIRSFRPSTGFRVFSNKRDVNAFCT